MEVPREDGMDAGLHQLAGNVVVVLDDVVGQQTLLLVEVGHQVVVHHRDDAFALRTGLGCTVDDPLQGLGLDAASVMVGIRAVATGGQGVEFVHIAVDADDDQTLDGFAAIAERRRVAP